MMLKACSQHQHATACCSGLQGLQYLHSRQPAQVHGNLRTSSLLLQEHHKSKHQEIAISGWWLPNAVAPEQILTVLSVGVAF